MNGEMTLERWERLQEEAHRRSWDVCNKLGEDFPDYISDYLENSDVFVSRSLTYRPYRENLK